MDRRWMGKAEQAVWQTEGSESNSGYISTDMILMKKTKLILYFHYHSSNFTSHCWAQAPFCGFSTSWELHKHHCFAGCADSLTMFTFTEKFVTFKFLTRISKNLEVCQGFNPRYSLLSTIHLILIQHGVLYV